MIDKSNLISRSAIPMQSSPHNMKKTEGNTGPALTDAFVPSSEKKPEKEWTILSYMAGSNELREYLTGNLKDMESVGSTDKMDVVSYISRDTRKWNLRNLDIKTSELLSSRPSSINNPWTGSRVYHIKQGNPKSRDIQSELIQDRGRESVRDPKTLQNFISWGMKNYPAKHYMVILSSHGAGYRGALMDRDGKLMSTPQIRQALEGAEKETGKKVDVLTLEACQMGQMEVAYEMQDATEFMVASPSKMFSNALGYKTILGEIDKLQKEGKEVSPESMAALIVEASEEFYDDAPTMTALDMKDMKAVTGNLSDFTKALQSTETPKSVIKQLVFESPEHDSSVYNKSKPKHRNFVDIIGFCNRVASSEEITDESLKQTATDLRDSINKATVDRKVHYGDVDDQGLAINLPTNKGLLNAIDPDYRELRMSKETHWDEYISGNRKGILQSVTGFIADKLGLS